MRNSTPRNVFCFLFEAKNLEFCGKKLPLTVNVRHLYNLTNVFLSRFPVGLDHPVRGHDRDRHPGQPPLRRRLAVHKEDEDDRCVRAIER